MNVWAGVLAAGEGRRLGRRPKALLRRGDRCFLEIIANTARRGGVAGVATVVGYHARAVEPVARDLCDVVVRNRAPERGMASSARVLAAALPPGAAMLLWPVDMPTVTAATIKAVIAAAESAPGRLVLPVAGGDRTPGHPPLLPAIVVEALAELDADTRLDQFIATRGGPPIEVLVDDPGVLRDVDRAEDLALVLPEGIKGRVGHF